MFVLHKSPTPPPCSGHVRYECNFFVEELRKYNKKRYFRLELVPLRSNRQQSAVFVRQLCADIVSNLLSICLSVYLFICLSVYLSICLSFNLSIFLSVNLSICLSVYLSICLICLFVYLSICLSVYLSICLSVYLSICLFTHAHITRSMSRLAYFTVSLSSTPYVHNVGTARVFKTRYNCFKHYIFFLC